jgi:serine/threonine protein phosphatase PrpC
VKDEGLLVTQPETPAPSPAAEETKEGNDIRVTLFARTDVGQVREHNEDNFLVADLTRRSRGLLEANRATAIGSQGAVFAVCDGMGGAAAGEIASQLAVDILYERLVDGIDDRAIKRDELGRRLVGAVESAGLEAGQLTEEEAETFEHNNIILQALGTADTVQVDLTFVELRKGDMLLLCSDGLSGMIRYEEIREVLRSSTEPLEICKALTERANQAGGHDNITVIVVQFDGAGLKPLTESDEPLKYRKYVLTDEPASEAEATAKHSAAPGGDTHRSNDGSVRPPPASSSGAAAPHGWQSYAADADAEAIEIPGTHVPVWMVVGIVMGVVVLLAGTAFLLLR